MTDWHFKSASELAGAIRDRAVGSEELLDHFIGRYEAHNQGLNAVVFTDFEGARAKARAADAAAAAEVLAAYRAAFEEFGRVLSDDDGILVGDSGGVIDAVFVEGRYLAGTTDAFEADDARAVAEQFRAQVRAALEQLP